MTRAHGFVAGLTALALGLALLAGPGPGTAADDQTAAATVPDQEVDQLVAQSARTIADALTGKVGKPGALKARTTAITIAAFEQHAAGGLTPARATVRDAALKLAEAIKDEKFDQAKGAATGLLRLPVNGSAKSERIKLIDDKIELEEFMGQFGSPRSGGLGIEKRLEALAEMKNLPPDSLEEVLWIADRALVVAAVVKPHDVGAKQKKWTEFSDAMAKEAAGLATAARSKNPTAALTAINRLNKSCNDCHTVFK